MRVERCAYVVGNISSIQDFIGPAVLASYRGPMAITAGSPSSSTGEVDPPPKKACFGAFLQVSSRYVCMWSRLLLLRLLLLLFLSLDLKSDFWEVGVVPRQL
jgi:hypothetical protein